MNCLKGVIDREEGDFYIIKFGGDQEIYWPKNNSGFIFKSGDAVELTLSLSDKGGIKEDQGAKDILRQIFQTNA